jgi:hypothetical protein
MSAGKCVRECDPADDGRGIEPIGYRLLSVIAA